MLDRKLSTLMHDGERVMMMTADFDKLNKASEILSLNDERAVIDKCLDIIIGADPDLGIVSIEKTKELLGPVRSIDKKLRREMPIVILEMRYVHSYFEFTP